VNEYEFVILQTYRQSVEQVQDLLNRYGKEGWQMRYYDPSRVVLERHLQSATIGAKGTILHEL